MSPTLVPFEPKAADTRSGTQRFHACWNAFEALKTALRAAGVHSPLGTPELNPVDKLLHEFFRSAMGIHEHWERRALKAERQLRGLVNGGVLSDEQREKTLEVLYGQQQGRNRDAAILSEQERLLVDRYRRMPDKPRRAMRYLFAELAFNYSDDEPEAAR